MNRRAHVVILVLLLLIGSLMVFIYVALMVQYSFSERIQLHQHEGMLHSLSPKQETSSYLSILRHFQGKSDDEEKNKDWKPIYVYRGGASSESTINNGQSWWNGQVEQDKLISWLTNNKTNGYFVDLAANGAKFLSNTLSLERLFNWSGLCIEANSEYWDDLGRYRSCTVVGAVVGKEENEKIMFAMAGTGGGIVGDRFDNNNRTLANRFDALSMIEERYAVPLGRIFDHFNVPKIIDYMSLDVEGAEDFIMDAFPFEHYRCRFLTIERPSAYLTLQLAKFGYRLVKKLVFFGDTLFAHDSELPIDLRIIERYCQESNGKYCSETESLIGFRLGDVLQQIVDRNKLKNQGI